MSKIHKCSVKQTASILIRRTRWNSHGKREPSLRRAVIIAKNLYMKDFEKQTDRCSNRALWKRYVDDTGISSYNISVHYGNQEWQHYSLSGQVSYKEFRSVDA